MPRAASSSRKAALEAIRARRNGLVSTSRTEEYEVKDTGDIYEVVEEDEYRNLVERRRERENFVVDDGTLRCYVTLRYVYNMLVLCYVM